MVDHPRVWHIPLPPDRSVPPRPAASAIERPAVSDALDAATGSHQITVVSAPAGMGKTTALSQWASRQADSLVWLSLAHFEGDPKRLYDELSTRLEAHVSRHRDSGPATPGSRGQRTLPQSRSRLVRALQAIDFPAILVVDDSHLSVPDYPAFLAAAPTDLRIVLSGRPATEALRLSRLRIYGSVASIGPETLSFDVADVLRLGTRLRTAVDDAEAARIHAATQGWPVAVHLALDAARTRTDGPAQDRFELAAPTLTDFVLEEVLGHAPEELADFVLATATCDELDAALANVLTGRQDGGNLLEQCVHQGLFLDRITSEDHTPRYRWNPVFAEQCRIALNRSGTARCEALNRRAAAHLSDQAPMAAAQHALLGKDPALAVRIIEDTWLGTIILARADLLSRTCGLLPRPWSEDPAILMIRAACTDLEGDRTSGTLLLDRAIALAAGSPPDRDGHARLDLVQALATLLVTDDRARLVTAADHLQAALHGNHGLSPSVAACALFLVGWQNLRLRRDPPGTVRLLRAAGNECAAVGLPGVARQATANLAFATAFAGDFAGAERLAPAASTPPEAPRTWLNVDGGQVAFTQGFLAYWRDDLTTASHQFRAAIQSGPVLGSNYATLARVFLAWTAAAQGDRAAMAEAESSLAAIGEDNSRGVPWRFYRVTAASRLAEARGDIEQARTLLASVAEQANAPMTAAITADSWRRFGEFDRALAVVDLLGGVERAPFVRASILLTEALVLDARGDRGRAHALLERSLEAAAPQHVRRPYVDAGPGLRPLLVEHAARGTRHEAFVGDLLARTASGSPSRPLPEPLSRREREIVSYLQTTMTNAEIASTLFVSVNTLKTHQRAIYRKLGVTNRRDAIRAYVGIGLSSVHVPGRISPSQGDAGQSERI